MASVSQDPSGSYRVQFQAVDGSRKTLRLPTKDRKVATSIGVHVEHLVNARITGTAVPPATAAWLAAVVDPLRSRLVAVGLIDPVATSTFTTLADFLDEYMGRQTHVKPASRLATQQAIRNLIDHFGRDCRISDITPGRADDFRKWLLSGGRSERNRNQARTLSGATVAKRLQRCSAIFADAVRRKLITEDPFAGLKRPPSSNRERQHYVPAEVIDRVVEEYAPNAEWRLLLAMARYLGVRVPSEPFSMTWDCVLWSESKIRIPSPKTAVHGKPFRLAPLLPSVRRHLEVVFEQAQEGTIHIFHGLRERGSARMAEQGFWANVNLRQELLRMLTRAGVRPWPRLWHNLRSSAQTDLANRFPAHVVCEWLGNTQAVAREHYLQVTPEHFQQAIGTDAKSDAKSDARPTQKPTQQGAEPESTETKLSTEMQEPQGFLHPLAAPCVLVNKSEVAAVGFEPTTSRL